MRSFIAAYKARSLFLALGLFVQSGVFAAAAPAPCVRIPLQGHQPIWISSSVWLEGKNELALVDPLQNRILSYRPDGSLDSQQDSRASSRVELPEGLARFGNGYLATSPALDGFLELDSNLSVTGKRGYSGDAGGAPGVSKELSPFNWGITGDSLAAFGSFKHNGSIVVGFFLAPLEGSPNITLVQSVKDPIRDADYYVLGFPYVAPAPHGFYYVDIEPAKPWQLKGYINGRREIITSARSGIASSDAAPQFASPMNGPGDAELLFAEIETLSIPVGLYYQDRLLYLVLRSPENHARTKWTVLKIDPANNKLLDKVILPTTADFLTIIPAPRRFFVIERGRVGPMQRQPITSMLAIPVGAMSSSVLNQNTVCTPR